MLARLQWGYRFAALERCRSVSRREEKGLLTNGLPKGSVGYAGLAAMICGGVLGGLAQTAMNTALPTMMGDLGFPVALGQWLVTVFSLCLGVVVPFVPSLLRRFGSRRVFLLAAGVFTIGSGIVVIAPSFALALIGRVLQGCGAGIMFPLLQTVALTQFPVDRRGTMMGFVGLAMGFAPNISPTIIGALTTAYGWRSGFGLFFILAVVVLIASSIILPKQEVDRSLADTVDGASVTCSTLGFGSLLLGFSNATDFGVASFACAIPLVVGVVFIALFVRRQLSISHPLLDLRVFAHRSFLVAAVMLCLLFCAFIGMTLVIPLGLQSVQGYSAFEAGLAMLPGTAAALIMNPVSGMLVDRVGPRAVTLLGSALLLLGTFMMLDLGAMTLDWVMVWQTVRAFGISSLITPIVTWGTSALPHRLVPDGASTLATVNQVSAALGTAAMVLLMAGGIAGGVVTAAGVDAAVLFSLAATCGLAALSVLFVRASSSSH